MYKKLLSIFLVFALMFAMLPVTVTDVKAATIVASGNCGVYSEFVYASNATWQLDSDGVLTISGTGFVFCQTSDNPESNAIHVPWNGYIDQVKELVIEDGIIAVWNGGFARHTNLEKVSLPKTLFTGDDGYNNLLLFHGCKNLKTVIIADGSTQIFNQMFNGCSNLTNLTLPSSVISIGQFAFSSCTSLETIDLSNVTSIGGGAFYDCAKLEISCNRADAYAIKYAKENGINCVYPSLEDAEITLSQDTCIADKTEKKPTVTVNYKGSTLVEGVDYTVSYKKNIEVGTATAVITGIGKYGDTVEKTFTLTKVSVNDATVTLEPNEFLADKTEKKPTVKLTVGSETLTEGVDYTVSYKDNINAGIGKVTITGIGKYYDTVREEQFTINGVSLENADISLKKTIYTYDGSAKTPTVVVKYNGVALTEGVDYSIAYKDNQDDGTAHVLVTGMGMFVDTVSKSFVILPYNSGMDSVYEDGMLISDTGVYGITDDEKNEVELCCPSKARVTDLKVPATITDENGVVYTVTSIGKEAFYKNTNIQSIEIGNNVKSIEDYAFYGCKNVKSIKLGKNVELIGGSAFRKCTKLTSITLPKSVKELGKNAFYGCTKLKTITINANSVVDINANAIKNISKKAVIKVPKKLVKEYKKELSKKTGFNNKSMTIKKK